MDGASPLKIASFLCSHKLQHPEMIISIKNFVDYLVFCFLNHRIGLHICVSFVTNYPPKALAKATFGE